MTNDLPTNGGSWTRDPKTGDLVPNLPPATAPTEAPPAPTTEPKKKEA